MLAPKKDSYLDSSKSCLSEVDIIGKFDNEDIKKYVDFFLNDFELLDNIYHRNNIYIYKSIYKKNKTQKIFAIKFIKNEAKKRNKHISKEISIHQKLKHYYINNLLGYNDLSNYSAMIYEFQKYGDLH